MGLQRKPDAMSGGYAQARMYAAMIRYMTSTPRWTYLEVEGVMGWSTSAVRRYVNALHDAKQIRIVDFTPDSHGRRTIRVFAFGPGEDYVLPKLTNNQYRQGKIERLRMQAGKPLRRKEKPVTQWIGGSPFS